MDARHFPVSGRDTDEGECFRTRNRRGKQGHVGRALRS